MLTFVKRGELIGTVGNTGNATNQPPHVHYSIFTPIPYVWNNDEFAVKGYLKMFYLNPLDYIESYN